MAVVSQCVHFGVSPGSMREPTVSYLAVAINVFLYVYMYPQPAEYKTAKQLFALMNECRKQKTRARQPLLKDEAAAARDRS